MEPITFYKYHGTGNDFILIDNRERHLSLSQSEIAWLCHRQFGVGADGLMLLEAVAGYDFQMVYFNADGLESTMCGNGGRCIAAFARKLGITSEQTRFLAIDGVHRAVFLSDGEVRLQMQDVAKIEAGDGFKVLDTGSPHYVLRVPDITTVDVCREGRAIRFNEQFGPLGGINVNFVQEKSDSLAVRTYERGVEAETLSCGTGVVASAIAMTLGLGQHHVQISTPGGKLAVSFTRTEAFEAQEVFLTGNAVFVFKGAINRRDSRLIDMF